MQTLSQAELLGFLELQIGTVAVQVPIRAAEPKQEDGSDAPLAAFAVEGDVCAILVRNDTAPRLVERAVQQAAKDALRHLSKQLLN